MQLIVLSCPVAIPFSVPYRFLLGQQSMDFMRFLNVINDVCLYGNDGPSSSLAAPLMSTSESAPDDKGPFHAYEELYPARRSSGVGVFMFTCTNMVYDRSTRNMLVPLGNIWQSSMWV